MSGKEKIMTPEKCNQLPSDVTNIINTWEKNDKDPYAEWRRINKELNAIGWECDWLFTGEIADAYLVRHTKGGKKINNILEKYREEFKSSENNVYCTHTQQTVNGSIHYKY